MKVDKVVAARARYVAEVRGVTLAEYLSETLRPAVDRDFRKAVDSGQGEPTKPGS